MNEIRFSLSKAEYMNNNYVYLSWRLECEFRHEFLYHEIITMFDGREITLDMAKKGIKPLRNCRRWPVSRDGMLRMLKKDFATVVASTHTDASKIYVRLKEMFPNIFNGIGD